MRKENKMKKLIIIFALLSFTGCNVMSNIRTFNDLYIVKEVIEDGVHMITDYVKYAEGNEVEIPEEETK